MALMLPFSTIFIRSGDWDSGIFVFNFISYLWPRVSPSIFIYDCVTRDGIFRFHYNMAISVLAVITNRL